MDAFAGTHNDAVQMIDTSIVRVHQLADCIARNSRCVAMRYDKLAACRFAFVQLASIGQWLRVDESPA